MAVDPSDPNHVLAGVEHATREGDRGLWQSRDGGRTWRITSLNWHVTGSEAVPARGIAFAPSNPSIVYVSGKRLYRSLDGGETWSLVPFAQGVQFGGALAIDPADSSTVFVSSPADGVFRTRDGGATWQPAISGLAERHLSEIFISAANSSLLVGRSSGAVYRSSNGGDSWTHVRTFNFGTPIDLAVDATLQVLAVAEPQSGRVWQSTDGGATWTNNQLPEPASRTLCVAVDPTDPSRVYAGTYRGAFVRVSAGAWVRAGSSRHEMIGLDVLPGGRTTLLARAFYGGVYRSDDRGGSWTLSSTGFPPLQIEAILPHETQPALLLGGTRAGVFRSTDSGRTWQATALNDIPVTGLVAEPGDPLTVYAATNDGVSRTRDGGATWTRIDPLGPRLLVRNVSVDPWRPGTVLFTSESGGHRSLDRGQTWEPANFGFAFDVLPDAVSTTLYMSYGRLIYRTLNGGASSTKYSRECSYGPPPSPLSIGLPTAGRFVRAPSDPAVVYLPWATPVPVAIPPYPPPCHDEKPVIVSWVTRDGLATFEKIQAASSFAVHPLNAARVALAGDGLSWDTTGIALSSDYGQTSRRHPAFPLVNGSAVAFSGDGNTLFVGTTEGFFAAAAEPCELGGLPGDLRVGLSGGAVEVQVSAAPGCDWLAGVDAPSVTLRGDRTRTGPATVIFDVAPSAVPRGTYLTIGVSRILLRQEAGACTVTVSPTSLSLPASGGQASMQVSVPPGACNWQLTNATPWLQVISGSGSGSGTAVVQAGANPGPGERTAVVFVGGKSVAVTQAAPSPACTVSATPSTMTLPESGGQVSVQVSTSPGSCSWHVSNAPSWLQLTSGSSGSGAGTAVLQAGANPGPGVRTGVLSIGGQSVTVTQLAPTPLPGCTFTVSPTTLSFPAAGASLTVSVTASASSCSWTTTENDAWLAMAGGGPGSAVVVVTAFPHTATAPRSSSISIAGQAVAITQQPFAPSAGTPVTTGDRRSVVVPSEAGAISIEFQDVTTGGSVVATSLEASPRSLGEPPPAFRFLPTRTYYLTASQELEFTQATACFPYSDDDLARAGMAETELRLFHQTNVGGPWSDVTTTVDPVANRLCGAVPHFSPFALGVPGTTRRYLAEGASSTFFGTRLALLNPFELPCDARLRFLPGGGGPIEHSLTIPPRSRRTFDAATHPALASAEFSTVVDCDLPLIVDRTMTWDATGYGAHGDTSVASPATRWYFAEGATHNGFDVFYLLQNPGLTPVTVRVRYLLTSGPPLEKTYELAPQSRFNIWTNVEDFPGTGLALSRAEFSAVIEALDGATIIAERAMYKSTPTLQFDIGHESAGVTAPSLDWFFAEGATGAYFDLFLLVANPNSADANVEASYLLPDGSVVLRHYTVPANSRFNIWVDQEDARLSDTAVSTTLHVTNGVPVVAERAMWWPGPTSSTWYEAHNAFGATTTGTRWALAEGEVGGARDVSTYILVANTSLERTDVLVTLLFEGAPSTSRVFSVPGRSRFNIDVRAEFPEALGRRFGAIVDSTGPVPGQLVVERAMYWNAGGSQWAAGTDALATKLQ